MKDKYDFWNLDQSQYKPEELAELCEQCYSYEFVDNHEYWKEGIKKMNGDILDSLTINYSFDTKLWQDITFNQFCKDIITAFKKNIIERGQLSRSDVTEISINMCQEWGTKMLQKQQEKLLQQSAISILMDNVKTFVAKKR